MWKSCGQAQFPNCPKLCGNCYFPQNFRTTKLGEISVFYAVFTCLPINMLDQFTNFYVPVKKLRWNVFAKIAVFAVKYFYKNVPSQMF